MLRATSIRSRSSRSSDGVISESDETAAEGGYFDQDALDEEQEEQEEDETVDAIKLADLRALSIEDLMKQVSDSRAID